jgi:hypothetical protein
LFTFELLEDIHWIYLCLPHNSFSGLDLTLTSKNLSSDGLEPGISSLLYTSHSHLQLETFFLIFSLSHNQSVSLITCQIHFLSKLHVWSLLSTADPINSAHCLKLVKKWIRSLSTFSLHYVQFGFVISKTVGLKKWKFHNWQVPVLPQNGDIDVDVDVVFLTKIKIYFCHEIQISATNLNFCHKISPTDSGNHTGPEGWLLQKKWLPHNLGTFKLLYPHISVYCFLDQWADSNRKV